MTDTLPETASQTAGPYVHIGLTPAFAGIETSTVVDLGSTMIKGPVQGEEITINGQIFDGFGTPLRDALIEIWQPDAAGLFASEERADPNFSGFGRCATNGDDGTFSFQTVKPGALAWPQGGMQTPHITAWIVARGINLGLQTRIYFSDEVANDSDPVLNRIEQRSRVKTLIAQKQEKSSFLFNIHLQGPDETVFFDV